MTILLYILLIILILAVLYVLYLVFLKFMSRYGVKLANRFGTPKNQKSKNNIQLNNNCLIAAFILFFLVIMPATNKILFLIMAILFAIRSLNGKISFARGIAMFFGSFLMGVFITNLSMQLLNFGVSIVILLISIPLLVLGFIRSA